MKLFSYFKNFFLEKKEISNEQLIEELRSTRDDNNKSVNSPNNRYKNNNNKNNNSTENMEKFKKSKVNTKEENSKNNKLEKFEDEPKLLFTPQDILKTESAESLTKFSNHIDESILEDRSKDMNEVFKKINELNTDMQKLKENKNNEIINLNKRITTQNKRITTLDQKISTLKIDNDLQSIKINSQQITINSLENHIKILNTKIKSLEIDNKNQSNQIKRLEIDNKNQSNINNSRDVQINSLKKDVNYLKNYMSKLTQHRLISIYINRRILSYQCMIPDDETVNELLSMDLRKQLMEIFKLDLNNKSELKFLSDNFKFIWSPIKRGVEEIHTDVEKQVSYILQLANLWYWNPNNLYEMKRAFVKDENEKKLFQILIKNCNELKETNIEILKN